MFSFFKRNKISTFDFLGIDCHSHIIPQIDDGSNSFETSLEILERLKTIGFDGFVFTPHIYPDFYPNTQKTIANGFENLKNKLDQNKYYGKLDFAAEYFVDQNFDKLISEDDLLVFGKNYVLIEISLYSWPLNLEKIIFLLLAKGYQPILAHPERYCYLENHLAVIKNLLNLGCLFQINLLSFVGFYGAGSIKLANDMMNEHVPSFLGTDVHNIQQMALLEKMTKNSLVMQRLSKYNWENKNLL